MIRDMRKSLADALQGGADRRRATWASWMADWERDTEPGYPPPGLHVAFRDKDLAVAGLYESLADAIRP